MPHDEDVQTSRLPVGIRRAVRRLRALAQEPHDDDAPSPPSVAFLRAPVGAGRSVVLEQLRRGHPQAIRAVGEPWARRRPLALLEQLFAAAGQSDVVEELLGRHGAEQAQQLLGSRLLRGDREPQQLGPVLVDDVHHADAASMQVLMHVARRMRHGPAVLVFSCPEESVGELAPEVASFLEDPRHLQVSIEPLEPAEILETARRLGVQGMDHQGARTLQQFTGGHVGPVTEILRRLPERRWPADPTDLPVPDSRRRAICSRVEEMSAAAQRFLDELAVAELATQWALHAHWSDPEAAPEVVDDGVRVGLLVETEQGARVRVRLSDPMIGRTLRDRMLPSLRRRLHRDAAAQAQDEHLSLWHEAKACTGHDEGLAEKLLVAAESAGRAGRWLEAAGLTFSAAGTLRSGEDRERALVQGVDALASAGDIAGVMPWLSAVEQIPPSPGRDLALANVALHRGRAAETRDLLARAERGIGDDDDLRRQLFQRRALDALIRWNGPALVEWADRAMALSRPEQPSYVESQAVRGVGLAAQGRSDAAEADILDASFAHSSGAQNQRFHLSAGWVALLSGHHRTAVRELEAAIPTRYRGGSLRISLWARGWLARVQYELGEWDEALRTAEDGLRRAVDSGMTLIAPLLAWTVGEIRLWRGQEAVTMSWPGAGTVDMNDYLAMQVPARLLRAVQAHALGDHDARLSLLMPLRETDPWTAERKPFWLWQPVLVEALLAADRVDEAQSLREEMEGLSSTAPPDVRAQVRASAGLIHSSQGEHDLAEGEYRAALALLMRVQRPVARADVRLAFGRSLRRAGRRRESADQLRAAADFYESVGAAVLAEQCAQELRATGVGHLRTAPATHDDAEPPSAAPTDFTPQEQSVADLVVRGHTNRETARLLYIAEKTVQYHLTRVYGKLGVRSRTELAAVYRPPER